MGWGAIAVTAAGCFALRLAGLSVPGPVLDRPALRRAAQVMPVALLSALIAVETVGQGQRLVVDARLAGLAAAALTVRARAPFLVVVGLSAAVTAAVRFVG